MLKSICLSLAAGLALAGCGSQTWSTVRAVRVDVRGEADPSAAYAARLSEQLTAAGVEHQVVTYQFRYRNRLSEEAIASRTAVVYRDEVNPRYPWWLMDERLLQPFWLPSGDLAHQIAFYIRGPVELVETQNAHGGGSGKATTTAEYKETQLSRAAAPKTSRGIAFRTSPSRATGAPARRFARQDAAASREQKHAWLRAREIRHAAPAPQRARTKTTASTASFRALHGTAFDPSSAIDRRKMEQLRQRGRRVARAF